MKFETYLWKNANISYMNYNILYCLYLKFKLCDTPTMKTVMSEWEVFLPYTEVLDRY